MNVVDLEGDARKSKKATAPKGGSKATPKAAVKSSSTTNKKSSSKRRGGKHSKQKSIDLFSKSPVSVIVAAACVALLAIGGIGYAVWYNSFTEVKLSDYASITLSGYDSYGSAQLDIDKVPEYASFLETVEAKLNYSENLSNGDELVITYNYDEAIAKENKLRVDGSDAHVTVNGLAASAVITHDDIFKGLSINYNGTAPIISVDIENISEEKPFDSIVYSVVDEKEFYDGGEELRIVAQIPAEVLENHAYDFDLSGEDFYFVDIVPFGDRYFTDASQVSDEILAELEQVGFDLIAQSNAKEYGLRIFQGEAKLQPVFVGNTTTFKWANPYVISAYFHAVTDEGKALLETHANDVQIVYGVTLTQADGTSVLVEMVIQFVDLLTHEDGTTDNASTTGRIVSVSYKDSNIKSLVNDDGSGTYITTKLTD